MKTYCFKNDGKDYIFSNVVANSYEENGIWTAEELISELEDILYSDEYPQNIYKECIQKEIAYYEKLQKNAEDIFIVFQIKRCKYNPTPKRARKTIELVNLEL